ncbi:MAG TPA: type II toxin-antitoxin system RelE/ParE family toxin [Tepidisphaeraceae bacterium]|jgi:plasmid stabilization system protein ParE|nr:type II toxin-antitoxin system RelE/ParE family toxin [Tepidisphaeraceae bacterium]
MKPIIDDQASDDLDKIYAWIAKDRPAAADAVVDRILAAIANLARLPHMGHAGRVAGTFEWVVRSLPYIIVYEIVRERNELIVIGVFHGAQEKRRP